jgi:predicted transcriptional regulator YdeE
MNIEIKQDLNLKIYGFSGVAINKEYVKTAFQLSDRMWKVVKGNSLDNKGKNIWVCESQHKVFAGVELNSPPGESIELEQKTVNLPKYAWYKHIGPYNFIKQLGENMAAQLKNQGLKTDGTYIEIYGHWTADENKLETELLMSIF